MLKALQEVQQRNRKQIEAARRLRLTDRRVRRLQARLRRRGDRGILLRRLRSPARENNICKWARDILKKLAKLA